MSAETLSSPDSPDIYNNSDSSDVEFNVQNELFVYPSFTECASSLSTEDIHYWKPYMSVYTRMSDIEDVDSHLTKKLWNRGSKKQRMKIMNFNSFIATEPIFICMKEDRLEMQSEKKSLKQEIHMESSSSFINRIDMSSNRGSIFHRQTYEIHVTHGDFNWIIRRHHGHFRQLHDRIVIKRLKLMLSNNRELIDSRTQGNKIRSYEQPDTLGNLPKFPFRPDAVVKDPVLRKKELEEYLQAVVNVKLLRCLPEMLSFLEVSRFSFVHHLGYKWKEGMVLKLMGNRKCLLGKKGIKLKGRWEKRWLVLKDTFLGYVLPKTKELGDIMLIDNQFDIRSQSQKHVVLFSNSSRILCLRCDSENEIWEWVEAINNVISTTGRLFYSSNEHGSFAPVRKNVPAQWYVDGMTYFEAVANAIKAAKEEIFIAGWWLTPELYLKRAVVDMECWRLDYLLVRKAEDGVKVFILLFKEIEFFLMLGSTHVLNSIRHKNIKILRHPLLFTSGRRLYNSHHEKIVIIDQSAAFLGGLDLALGRWDTTSHEITDLSLISKPEGTARLLQLLEESVDGDIRKSPDHSRKFEKTKSESIGLTRIDTDISSRRAPSFHGGLLTRVLTDPAGISRTAKNSVRKIMKRHYNSPLNRDRSGTIQTGGFTAPTTKVTFSETGATDALQDESKNSFTTFPRLPFGLEEKRKSDKEEEESKQQSPSRFQRMWSKSIRAGRPIAQRLSRLQRKKTVGFRVDPVRESCMKRMEMIDKEQRKRKITYSFLYSKRFKTQQISSRSSGEEEEPTTILWKGQDYVNWIEKNPNRLHEPFTDRVDRSEIPRMPWHDISCSVYGLCARDIARHFIERWNAVKREMKKTSVYIPCLVPKSYESSGIDSSLTKSTHLCTGQVLRSASEWSAGISQTDNSIYKCYLAAIASAEHFIYIENQFFISKTKDDNFVSNEIGDALYTRIMQKHEKRQTFRVYIVVPLLPAVEGTVLSWRGAPMRSILHYQLRSLCQGPNSLLGRLRASIKGNAKAEDYLTINSLRNHSFLNGKPQTELVYVHSKLLIVDDMEVIIGSANINDRSMAGDRDSEIAVHFRDQQFQSSFMNKRICEVGRLAQSLRCMLMCEHLGLDYKKDRDKVLDPVCTHFFDNVWSSIAMINSQIYEKVFRCYPTNKAKKLTELRKYLSEPKYYDTDPVHALTMLSNIKGHLVSYPVDFLSEEHLRPGIAYIESLIPRELWT